jgi:hypothetical protein
MSKVMDFIVLCAEKAYQSRRVSVMSMYDVNESSSENLTQPIGLDVNVTSNQTSIL